MIKGLLNANRRRVPMKYALLAGALAVVSIVGLEAAGSALTSSYSGLGGKLSPGSAGSAEIAPARASDPSDTPR